MDLYEKLREAGLTGNESKVYLELLKKGYLSANQISKNIGMDRSLTYSVLNHLVEKGQVSYAIREGKKYFKTSNPTNLLNTLEKKQIVIGDLIEELKQIRKQEDFEQEIYVYEGRQGLRSFYRIFFEHKEFYTFGATGKTYDYLYEAPAISKEIGKKGIKVKLITSPENKNHPMIKLKGIQAKYLDIKSTATTTIFGNYTSIHLIKDKPLIILIKNKEIAETYKNYFEVLWNTAKK